MRKTNLIAFVQNASTIFLNAQLIIEFNFKNLSNKTNKYSFKYETFRLKYKNFKVTKIILVHY